MHRLFLISSRRFLTLILTPLLTCAFPQQSNHATERPDEIMIGKWLGALNPEIHVYYEISRKWDGSLMGCNGIVELKLSGGPVEVVTLNHDTVRFEELESNQCYVGTLDREHLTIKGEYSNLNISNSWPLVLQRVDSLPLPP